MTGEPVAYLHEMRNVRNFTKDENPAFNYSWRLLRAGYAAEADEAWEVFTSLEHYRSHLPCDPNERTHLQRLSLLEFEADAREFEERADKLIGESSSIDIMQARCEARFGRIALKVSGCAL